MENTSMINMLEIALNNLQARTIGLFQNTHPLAPKKLELVLVDLDGILHTVTIGELGGLCETHIPKEKGIFKAFPENKTLEEMKKDPFSLKAFIESFPSK